MSGAAERAVSEVVALARWAGGLGLVPATSGNFSVRFGAEGAGEASLAITMTGVDKSELGEAQVVVLSLREAEAGDPRLSAETPLHLERYAADPRVGAVVHVHPLEAVVLSRRHRGEGALSLEGWELAKALSGVSSHEATVTLPIVDNDQDLTRLAARVRERLAGEPATTWGYLVAGHGLYAFGRDAREARRHAEAYCELLRYQLEEERRA